LNRDFFDDEIEQSSGGDNKEQSSIWTPSMNFQAQYSYAYPKKPKRKKLFILLLLAFMLIVGMVLTLNSLYGKGWLENLLTTDERTQIVIPIQDKPVLESDYFDEETGKYTPQGIAKAVMPSVVSILVYEQGMLLVPSSQGSGIILTENGYIITNAHVVENATRGIKVILFNEEEYQAEIVGYDSKTDLAVIKINAENLTPAVMGNSDQLEIGEEIVALGSPAGLYGSLTKGVVSGLDRMIKTEIENIEMNCIQIDAAINPGNSGGALVNMYGQVVGISSSKFASELYDGIGFAISINAARPILEELISEGYIKGRVRIGITFHEVSDASAEIYETEPGLYIAAIDESCDIANSGLAIDDTITHINGYKVTNAEDVDVAIEGKKPGDMITATVFRQSVIGESETFEITFLLMEDISSRIPQSDD